MRTYKIHLIRHGLTDANLNGSYIGCNYDLPLCPEGVNELRTLKDILEYPVIGRLYSSPMLRCRQTAGIIYPGYEIFPIEELKEFDFGEFEGKTAAQLEGHPAFAEWNAGRISAPPGGEDTKTFIKRLCLGLNRIVCDMMENDITESAAIMHGGAVMMLLSSTAVPRRNTLEWTSENGRGYSIRITPSLYHSSGVVEVYGTV